MMKSWDKNQRFDSARAWIDASLARRGASIDGDILDALAQCCVKRRGVYRLRKTTPKPGACYMAYHAFKFARHAKQWGNLAPWGEAFTAELMRASDTERELFNRAFDQFCNVGGK